jgi:hypothetical protein
MAVKWERYLAIVTDNQDEEQRGRIKVACPDFIGTSGKTDDEDITLEDWIEPIHDWGWFYVPDIDEVVEIEVQVGSDEDEVPFQSAIYNPAIRWRSKRYWGGEDTKDPRPIPEDFKANYGKRRGFATPWGHTFIFDDTEGKELVRLALHRKEGEDDKFAFLAMNEEGSIVMSNQNGTIVHFDAKNKAFSIIDEHGNTYASDESALKIIDKTGNFVEVKDGLVTISSQGGVAVAAANVVDVACDEANIKAASKVTLGDAAAEAVVKGDTWKTLFDGHKHPTGVGPSGPPIPGDPIPSADCLSTKVTTE